MDRNRMFIVVDRRNPYKREAIFAQSQEQAIEKSTINKKIETWGIPVNSCYAMETYPAREHRHQEVHTTLERPSRNKEPQEPIEGEILKPQIPATQRPY